MKEGEGSEDFLITWAKGPLWMKRFIQCYFYDV
jgi:hypothetical protein